MLEKNVKNSWTEMIKNGEGYIRMITSKSILKTLILRSKLWLGHLIRNNPWITKNKKQKATQEEKSLEHQKI